MNSFDSGPAAVRSAARQSQQLVTYLLNGPDDPAAWAELARLADGIRAEAAAQSLSELEGVAASIAAMADVAVLDAHTTMELDAAADRLLVLTDRASQSLEALTLPEEDAVAGPYSDAG